MDDAEAQRLERLAVLNDGGDADWPLRFAPGSFGCHELLDRTLLAMNSVDEWLLTHPACVHRRDWYGIAYQAFEALEELYQKVGDEHLKDLRNDPEVGR